MKNIPPRLIPIWLWIVIAIVIAFITASACMAQQARPTYSPFNNGRMMSYYGPNVQMPQYGGYNQQRPNYYQQPNNNFTFGRPNANYGFQNNYQRPQQQFYPQNQPQYSPQQNNYWQQRPQPQQRPQTNNVPLFTRTFHLNNGYLYGRPTLWYDPKSGKMQPWVRKNLR